MKILQKRNSVPFESRKELEDAVKTKQFAERVGDVKDGEVLALRYKEDDTVYTELVGVYKDDSKTVFSVLPLEALKIRLLALEKRRAFLSNYIKDLPKPDKYDAFDLKYELSVKGGPINEVLSGVSEASSPSYKLKDSKLRIDSPEEDVKLQISGYVHSLLGGKLYGIEDSRIVLNIMDQRDGWKESSQIFDSVDCVVSGEYVIPAGFLGWVEFQIEAKDSSRDLAMVAIADKLGPMPSEPLDDIENPQPVMYDFYESPSHRGYDKTYIRYDIYDKSYNNRQFYSASAEYNIFSTDTSRLISELENAESNMLFSIELENYVTDMFDSATYIIPKINIHSVDFSSGERRDNIIKINEHDGWILSTNKNGVPFAQAKSESVMRGSSSSYISFSVPKEFKGYIEISFLISPGMSDAIHASLKDIVLVSPGVDYPERFNRKKDIVSDEYFTYGLVFFPTSDTERTDALMTHNISYADPLYKGNILEKVLPVNCDNKPKLYPTLPTYADTLGISSAVEIRSKDAATGELNTVTFSNGSTKLMMSNDLKEEDCMLKIPENFDGWIEFSPVIEGSNRKLDKLVLKTSKNVVYPGGNEDTI